MSVAVPQAAGSQGADIPQLPDFITFLFSTKPKFDCYFLVGKKDNGNIERIGAVKLMLMAHSEVLRLELDDSELAEKGDVPVDDIYPDTFRSILKYVYGYDTTAELCFEDADNMFYAAEKYMMKRLKDKLATRLIQLINPDNICALLNNPACYTHLELNSTITKILQFDTRRVLSNPQFVGLSPDAFVLILEQEGLAAQEIDLWRAAIKWAKHRAGSDEGEDLRKEVSKLSKHLRICTLSSDQLCQEVLPTKILNKDEVAAVCLSIHQKKKQDDLSTFSNEIIPRKKIQKGQTNGATRKEEELRISFDGLFSHKGLFYGTSTFRVLTKQSAIELLPVQCLGREHTTKIPPANYKLHANYIAVCVILIKDYTSGIFEEVLVKVFCENVEFENKYVIPLSKDGKNVKLLPHRKYLVEMNFTDGQILHFSDNTHGRFEDKHLIVEVPRPFRYPGGHISYRVIHD